MKEMKISKRNTTKSSTNQKIEYTEALADLSGSFFDSYFYFCVRLSIPHIILDTPRLKHRDYSNGHARDIRIDMRRMYREQSTINIRRRISLIRILKIVKENFIPLAHEEVSAHL